MYDIEKRCSAMNITVGDFCKYLLENVSTDAVFHVGGISHFYLHIDSENQAVSVDDSDFPVMKIMLIMGTTPLKRLAIVYEPYGDLAGY